MLNWLTSKLGKTKGDQHPLGSPAAIRRFLEAIEGGQPAEILSEIGDWLGDGGRMAAELPAADCRRAVRALDEFAQPAIEELWRGLFGQPNEEVAEDCRLSLSQYFGHAAAAYRITLEHFPPQTAISTQERSELGLFALRALRFLGHRNKLYRMRYRVGGTDHWSAVHELFRLARTRGVVATNYPLYEKSEGSTSFEIEYVHCLLFEVAPLDNMAPRQMEVVDRYLRQSAKELILREEADAGTPFIVDLQSAAPPQRWHPGMAMPAEWRFFGPGMAHGAILQVLNILQQDMAPGWLASVPISRQSQAEALLLLRDHWSQEPPQRIAPRTPEQGVLMVVHGFAEVRRMVAVSTYVRSGHKLSAAATTYTERTRLQKDYFGTVAETAVLIGPAAKDADENLTPIEMIQRLEAAGDKDQRDRWQMADASATGIGVIAPLHRPWFHVGALIGYRRETAVYWQVAVIRRLGRSSDGRRLIGLRLLQGIPQPVHVKAVAATEAENLQLNATALSEFDDAILLSTNDGTLLVEPRHTVGDRLLIAGEKLRLVVRLAERVDGTGEFKLFRYEPA